MLAFHKIQSAVGGWAAAAMIAIVAVWVLQSSSTAQQAGGKAGYSKAKTSDQSDSPDAGDDASGKGRGSAAKCTMVTLDALARIGAAAIAQRLDGVADGVRVRALDQDVLLVCGDSGTTEQIRDAIAALSHRGHLSAVPPENHTVRLFFNRNAAALALILSKVFPDVPVSALGSDVLVFQSNAQTSEEHVRELKRWVALIDLPRPEVVLNVWSAQLSASEPDKIATHADQIQAIVSVHNEQLKLALERGWRQLLALTANPDFFATEFRNYVARQFSETGGRGEEVCGGAEYCLGFLDAFRPVRPTLSNMIGVLAGARDRNAALQFVDCMEGLSTCPFRPPAPPAKQEKEKGKEKKAAALMTSPALAGSCEQADDSDYTNPARTNTAPAFHCFRQQLVDSFLPERLLLFRLAIADFLFQYKFSVQYPHDFGAYDFTASSQTLDSQFEPLLVAFNRDVAVYLAHLQKLIENEGDGLEFKSNGTVSVRTISGADSGVDSATQNSFQNTPPPLVQDFVSQLTAAEKATPQLFQANLSGNAATALAAFLNSGKSSTVTIGRDLNLKVTPISLPGAGAVELKIHVDAKDDGKPQVVAPDGTAKNDTTDRVSQHTVDTNVRVDSLKLVDISSLSAALSRGRDPIPLLPPFVELPYIGSLIKLKRPPSTVFHRSLIVIGAVVVPTAADLLSQLRYHRDEGLDEKPLFAPLEDLTARHRAALKKIFEEAMPAPGRK